MRKLILILLGIHLILSIIILVPAFYFSTREFFASLGMTTQEKWISKYGYFFRSMKEYVKKIPINENAVIFEPPGEYANYFWVLNYFFLPRKIYTFPEYFLLDEDFVIRHNIKFILVPQEERFYFKRHVPRIPDIITRTPANYDTLTSAPRFIWIPKDTCNYTLSLCNESEEVLNTYRDLKILLKDEWIMPADYWSSIPTGQKIYWFVQSIDRNYTSKLMVFYKK
ncbi:MAG: hypothetical protein ABIL22_04595 [candidate division WOR-3 bacterium]